MARRRMRNWRFWVWFLQKKRKERKTEPEGECIPIPVIFGSDSDVVFGADNDVVFGCQIGLYNVTDDGVLVTELGEVVTDTL